MKAIKALSSSAMGSSGSVEEAPKPSVQVQMSSISRIYRMWDTL